MIRRIPIGFILSVLAFLSGVSDSFANTNHLRMVGPPRVQDGRLQLRWLSTNSGPEQQYQIICRTNPTQAWSRTGLIVNTTNASVPISSSGPTCFFAITTDMLPPTVPGGLQVTASTCSSVSLRWNGAFDNFGGSGIRTYSVFRNGTLLRQVSSISNSITDANLNPITTYQYSVSATDNVGNESSRSSVVTVTTAACSNGQPVAIARADQTVVVAGGVVRFDGTDSFDPEGPLTAYSWSFGDGNGATGPIASNLYRNPGTYLATLYVTDSAAATATNSITITVTPVTPVNEPPVASAGPDLVATVGVPVTLSGTGSFDRDGTIASYAWRLVDGTTGSGPVFSHAFMAPGQFTVTLRVTDNSGDSAEDTVVVNVAPANQSPVAVAGPAQVGRIGVPLSFSAAGSRSPGRRLVSFNWNFGNGSTAAGLVVSNTFPVAGQYSVGLTVTDDAGASATTSTLVTIVPPDANQPPSANTTPVAATSPGSAVLFDASGSVDPDGTINSYSWDYGDGNTGAGLATVYRYAAGGTFVARLTVRDSAGISGVWHKVVAVSGNQAPQAFAGPDQTHTLGAPTRFSAAGSMDDGAIASYQWDFGDGASSSGVYVEHVYSAPGTYTAVLRVTDNAGLTATDTVVVTILPSTVNLLPVARLSGQSQGNVGLLVYFDGSQSTDLDGTMAGYRWDFGDGQVASGANASHAYAAAGIYTVTLTVTDNLGASASATTTAQIGAALPPKSLLSATNIGGSRIDVGESIGVDRSGNVFVGGSYDGRPILIKRAPDGRVVWTYMPPGGVGGGSFRALAVNASGEILLAGNFTGNLDFGCGPLTSAGRWDIFLAKLSSSGVCQWSKRFGGPAASPTSEDCASGIALDTNDNSILLTGCYDSGIDFGGGPLPSYSPSSMFLAKFASNGDHLWSRHVSGTGMATGRSVAVDRTGNVFVTGSFSGPVDFVNRALNSYGGLSSDMFLAKFSGSGVLSWVRQYGQSGSSVDGISLALDAGGDVALLAQFYGPASVGGPIHTNAGGGDIVLAKYSGRDGAYIWSTAFGGSALDSPCSLTVDALGRITIAGMFLGSINFGGGLISTPSGGGRAYLASFEASGAYRWASAFGIGSEMARAVLAGADGRIYCTGRMGDSLPLGSMTLVGAGYSDVFIVEFTP